MAHYDAQNPILLRVDLFVRQRITVGVDFILRQQGDAPQTHGRELITNLQKKGSELTDQVSLNARLNDKSTSLYICRINCKEQVAGFSRGPECWGTETNA